MKLKNLLFLLAFMLIVGMLAACSDDTADKDEAEDTEQSEETEDTGDAKDTEGTESTDEKVLSFTNPEGIRSMDPAIATDETSFIYLAATMEGLYRLDENTRIAPGIAIDHKVSDDGLTWTYNLRDDAVWSNGEPVTAHDFVY